MRVYLAFFFATYVVVQVITFTECNPFDHYWQVLPAPGRFESHTQIVDEPNFLSRNLHGGASTTHHTWGSQHHHRCHVDRDAHARSYCVKTLVERVSVTLPFHGSQF